MEVYMDGLLFGLFFAPFLAIGVLMVAVWRKKPASSYMKRVFPER